MEGERRGDLIEGDGLSQPPRREELGTAPKAFAIPKRAVFAAGQRGKANRGAAGIDGESRAAFAQKLSGNLYRVWNRLGSGSYFPPPVKEVEMPKARGGMRPLGIPPVGDRVAQTVAKMALEPQLEPHFDPDSYGYRPGKAAQGAGAVTRPRCGRSDWVVEFASKGACDKLDHGLLMKAVRKHTDGRGVLLYVERWWQAPTSTEAGEVKARQRGTPQGGGLGPLVLKLFFARCLGPLAATGAAEVPVCALCGCRGRAGPHGAAGAGGEAPTRGPLAGVRVGATSGQDAECLRQGQQSRGRLSHASVYLPGLHGSAAAGAEPRGRTL